MITRSLQEHLEARLATPDKIVILYGPRQVGKTTLVRQVLERLPGKKLEINADEFRFVEALSSRSLPQLRQLVAGYDLFFLDEAQRIPEVGINLKILHDHLPELRIVATGSSALDLAGKIREPLTGRTWTLHLYPISVGELAATHNRFELDQRLEEFLVFGGYPGVLVRQNREDKAALLKELTLAYLYKDVLDLGIVKYSPKLRDLTRLLAYQIGSEVSMNELSNKLSLHRDVVETYIDLLEKSFVLFRLSGYSRNLRKEIRRHDKVYFYDLGIRNAIIDNFKPLAQRDDDGRLWENFLMVERLKTQAYRRQSANRFFWRTYTGAELDYVEERDGRLHGFEFKFSNRLARQPKAWLETYSEASFQTVNRENYLDFIL